MKIFQINFQTAFKYNSQVKQSGAFQRSTTLLIAVVAMFIGVTSGNYAFAQSINKKALSDDELVKKLPGFKSEFSEVNGVKLHYVEGGTGKILVLLPGWPQNWWEYNKVMPELSKKYHLIVVDYRGMGSSDKPAGGYDKKTIAADVYGLLQKLGYRKAFIAGHDIGAQVAFSLAANYPGLTEKLIIMDVPHPDESFAAVTMLPALGTPTDKLDPARPFLWWFAFNQMRGMPEDLLEGRFALAQKYIFHYLLKDDRSINAFDRAVYANVYNNRDAIRAGNGWYQAFAQDIADYKTYSKLTMPVLGIGGPGYNWLKYSLPEKTLNLKVEKVEDSGHFIVEEQPSVVIQDIIEFLD